MLVLVTTLVALSSTATSTATAPTQEPEPALAGVLAGDDEVPGLGRVRARSRLTGSWGGARPWLAERGVGLDLFYTFDVLGLATGGLRPGVEVFGNLDLLVELDFEAMFGWSGARLVVYGLGTHGGALTPRVGDVQTINNIEAPYGWRLFEAHFSQAFFEDRFSVQFGLYDTNSEFDVVPVAAFFVHSSFGMGGDVGTSGRNGPSTFPASSLALRVQARPVESVFVRAVVADGVPGDPERPGVTSIEWNEREGLLWIAEVGWLNLPSAETTERVKRRFEEPPPPDERGYGRFGKVAVGAWGYTTDFAPGDPGGGPGGRGTTGVYALVQQTLFRERRDPSDGMSVFLRGGVAESRGHQVRGYLGGGVVYEGLSPARWRDRIGLAAAGAEPVVPGPWEVAIELTYRLPLFPWLSLQPDAHLVVNPALDPEAGTALVLGLRSLLKL